MEFVQLNAALKASAQRVSPDTSEILDKLPNSVNEETVVVEPKIVQEDVPLQVDHFELYI